MKPYFVSNCGKFTLYNGDTVEVLDQVRDDFGDGSIQLVVTSPPYFQQKEYESGSDDWEMKAQEDYVKWASSWIHKVKYVCGDSFWLNIGGKYDDRSSFLMYPFLIAHEMTKNGWRLKNIVAWDKGTAAPMRRKKRLHNQWEPFFFFTRRDENYFNKSGLAESLRINIPSTWTQVEMGKVMSSSARASEKEKTIGASGAFSASKKRKKVSGRKYNIDSLVIPDVWRLGNTNSTARWHPAIFSDSIVKPIVAACSKDNNIVLDPFMGSGSTARAALSLGRRVIGIELSKEYCDKMIETLRADKLIDNEQIGLFSNDEIKRSTESQSLLFEDSEIEVPSDDPEFDVDFSKMTPEQIIALGQSTEFELNIDSLLSSMESDEEPF